jgi:hypothetical protein
VAELSQVDFLVFVDEKVTIVDPRTLQQLVGNASRDGVGVVGAVAIDKRRNIVSAGVTFDRGTPIAGFAGESWDRVGHHDLAHKMRSVSAVQTTVMVTPRVVFESVGGFRDQLSAKYGDIGYCLDVRSASQLRVVLDPVMPVQWEGPNRLDETTSEHEEIAFASLLAGSEMAHEDYLGHGDPSLVAPYERRDAVSPMRRL